MQAVIDKHYERLATDYDEYLYYSPEFVRSLTSKMIDKLRLVESDTLTDIGCGTGMYSLDILKQIELKYPVIGVDPYESMLEQIPDGAPISRVAEDALTFSNRKGRYNKVLIKETIHHVDRREDFFRNLYANLPAGGIMLLAHVPPNVKYPLFEAALNRCLGWHTDPNELVQQMEDAGFEVKRDGLDYLHKILKDHYFRMVKSCYMSVLTSFSVDELQAGLAEMESKYKDVDALEFVDHFDFLTATKPAR